MIARIRYHGSLVSSYFFKHVQSLTPKISVHSLGDRLSRENPPLPLLLFLHSPPLIFFPFILPHFFFLTALLPKVPRVTFICKLSNFCTKLMAHVDSAPVCSFVRQCGDCNATTF